MLKCVIIEDEPLASSLIKGYVDRSNDLELKAIYHDPLIAVHELKKTEVDLIFLDIQMPELTGIQVMKIFREDYYFILTTAYEEYALEGYQFNIVDYLLKPISFERFLAAVEKVKERIAGSLKYQTSQSGERNYVFVKSGYQTRKVDFNQILYLESMGDYVAIHTLKGKIMTLDNLGYFENILPENNFARSHRSYIVSLNNIEFIERNRIKIGNKLIPVSKKYHDQFWLKVHR